MDNADAAEQQQASPSAVDPHARYHEQAWLMLATGQKPTADGLLQIIGGTKQTAVAALRSFWSEYARQKITGKVHGDTPHVVVELARNVWTLAREVARGDADAALEMARGLVSQREAELAERETRLADRTAVVSRREADLGAAAQAQTDLIGELRRSMTGLEAQLKTAMTRGESLDTLLTDVRGQLDGARGDVSRLQSELSDSNRSLADRIRETSELARSAEQSNKEAEAAKKVAAEHQQRLEVLTTQLDEVRTAANTATLTARAAQDAAVGAAVHAVQAAHKEEFARFMEAHLDSEQRLQVDLRKAQDKIAALERQAKPRGTGKLHSPASKTEPDTHPKPEEAS